MKTIKATVVAALVVAVWIFLLAAWFIPGWSK